MPVRILNEADVCRLLPMPECIEVMERTLTEAARGGAVNPLRQALRFPAGNGLLGMMPAYLGSPACAGIKVVTVMPGNHGTPFDSHQGAVILFEVEHGRLLAVIDASAVTAIRTAAVSAVATRLLAREDASVLAILGSGVQAGTHFEAILAVRRISEVRVWSRSLANARAFADRVGSGHGVVVRVSDTARAAVEGAGIVCTVTSAREPVLEGEWLSRGAHVNAAGACLPNCRELDTSAVVRSRLFVDRRESALKEAGDFLIPKAEGAIGDNHIVGEIGEVLAGKLRGRTSDGEVTLFKSLGIGIEDLGAARHLYAKAEEAGAGVVVELGGRRDAAG